MLNSFDAGPEKMALLRMKNRDEDADYGGEKTDEVRNKSSTRMYQYWTTIVEIETSKRVVDVRT